MNLYLITRKDKHDYDEYDSAVVAAESEEAAKKIHPDGRERDWWSTQEDYPTWTKLGLEGVNVRLIGKSKNLSHGVVLSSFNAG